MNPNDQLPSTGSDIPCPLEILRRQHKKVLISLHDCQREEIDLLKRRNAKIMASLHERFAVQAEKARQVTAEKRRAATQRWRDKRRNVPGA
jgi:hypothetical protein